MLPTKKRLFTPRPFKDRIVRNCNFIDVHVVMVMSNFFRLRPTQICPRDLVLWTGLKPTKTALLRARSALKKGKEVMTMK